MSADRINDNVGKKIVEALRKQNSGVLETESFDIPQQKPLKTSNIAKSENSDSEIGNSDNIEAIVEETNPSVSVMDSIDIAFKKSLAQNLPNEEIYEYPTNVAVLCSLLTRIPAGVSPQTAAQIISQTMEALGITMSSVMQEAKQVQADLSTKVRECQKTILDCRKQIENLEHQAQDYQRQVIKLNDVINLFVKTNV